MNPAWVVVCGVLASFASGAWWQANSAAEARADMARAHAAEIGRIAAANEAAIARAEADRDALVRVGEAAARQLAETNMQIVAERDALQRRLDHAATQYRPAPGAAVVAVPRAVITCGAWRVLNRAADTDPAAGGDQTAAAAFAATDAACTDDALDSGLSLADLYAWQRAFAERSRTADAQLVELIGYVMAIGQEVAP